MQAGQTYLEKPAETPFIPTWNRVHAADPALMVDMLRAVADDYDDYT